MPNVTSKFSQATVKIYINGILHLCIERAKLLGFSSWQYSTEGGLYYIQIVLDGGVVDVDYDNHDLWMAILTALDAVR